jgi:hypothetical protein
MPVYKEINNPVHEPKKNVNFSLALNWTKPESVNVYIGNKPPACLRLSSLQFVHTEEAIDVNDESFWIERFAIFSCIANDAVLTVLRNPPFCWVFLDDSSVQNFKCFLPAVMINFASDEKLTLETVEPDEVAWSFVIRWPLRQSQM